MKRATCPFCGRKFVREPRALLAEKYCRNCIKERVQASGGKQVSKNAMLIQTSPGYYVLK